MDIMPRRQSARKSGGAAALFYLRCIAQSIRQLDFSFLKNAMTISCCAAIFSSSAAAQSVTQILIDKSDRILWLMKGAKVLRIYRDIKLGDVPVGHKQFEGDEKTPEGRYRISGRNGGSRYHLSLRISYPVTKDRAAAARAGRSPGGDIFIHGQPNGSPLARIPTDWTDGCIALSNAEMANGTPVTIRP
jgi:murein L,D-transpeptidase YafK